MPAALIHRSVVRHWMNARVRTIRSRRLLDLRTNHDYRGRFGR
jgi:hypothetical protein